MTRARRKNEPSGAALGWSTPPSQFTVRRDSAATSEGSDEGWRITDGDGEVVAAGLESRRQAIRLMASYAAKRPLPLRLEDASGRPTGDRLG